MFRAWIDLLPSDRPDLAATFSTLRAARNDNKAAEKLVRSIVVDFKRGATDCSAVFQRYFISLDERFANVPREKLMYRGGALQSVLAGTPAHEVVFVPGKGCALRPAPRSEFFKSLATGRLAGQYSPRGFPEAVKISVSGPQGQTWPCSGVLLGSRWVLTAAHCFETATRSWQSAEVSFNGQVAMSRIAADKPIQSAVKGQPFIQDGYRKAIKDSPSDPLAIAGWDLALAELAEPLVIDSKNVSSEPPKVPARILGTLAGYGVNLVTPTPAEAGPVLDVSWLSVAIGDKLLEWKANIAVGDSASCPGDSGAPIYVTADSGGSATDTPAVGCFEERRMLIGLVSYGQYANQAACLQSSSGTGPRLLPHLPWICQVSKELCAVQQAAR